MFRVFMFMGMNRANKAKHFDFTPDEVANAE